jgi:hypothetical protein
LLDVNLEEILEHEDYEPSNIRIDIQPSNIDYTDIKDDY